ncbi:heavy metal translocating P-type ATPase [Pararhizobium sp. DWP1-1-3]|uniref:heavy metal translocating P-type ATPase n=1 Tax=Pararhizobium sp. DWP1-1-3 TaxID=2804652 RepID=UPI003CEDFCDD
MSCCAVGNASMLELEAERQAMPPADEIRLLSHGLGDGLRQTNLSVPNVHCAACIGKIERALSKLDGVENARVNLSTRRVSIRWRDNAVPDFCGVLYRLGYPAHLFSEEDGKSDRTRSELIRAVAVCGFSTANIMLLSVSVWSGAEGATRDMFHWVSALIALPALLLGGGIFFRSAASALRHGRTNMDVPIAVGISLAFGMSLYETINHGPHAYFDAVASLLFFLLIGRVLDHVMREKARSAVSSLVRMTPAGAVVLGPDGAREYMPLARIEPGMQVFIAAGDRIPVDAVVRQGLSELDCSLVTGESDPRPVKVGDVISAGTLNLTGPLTIAVTAAAEASFLAEVIRLMEAAEAGRGLYRRIADRAASYYAPAVHLTAFLTGVGWLLVSGDWHKAITIAIAVLIITCPCALGLAVPIVQVVAARRLFERGIMVKDGSAMERLAEADVAVFDKTGTLTLGNLSLAGSDVRDETALAIAVSLAGYSSHPASRAIWKAHPGLHYPDVIVDQVTEHPGLGIEATIGGKTYRLGRSAWAGPEEQGLQSSTTVLSQDGIIIARFTFSDRLRPDAASTIRRLQQSGMPVELLSGDTKASVQSVAKILKIERYGAGLLPAVKLKHLQALVQEGRRPLMVGDGLNDAPALTAAHVSMAPATAADVGRNAADFVFLRESLSAVVVALDVSRRAGRLIRQNLALAIGYNAFAVPIAVLGYVTPLVAAIAMSASSLLVIANALRLNSGAADFDETSSSSVTALEGQPR